MTALADDDDLEVSLLERYCADTASAGEAARIEVWFREHPDQRVWYEEFKSTLKKNGPLMPEEKVNAALAEFLQAALQRHAVYDGEQREGRRPGEGIAYLATQTPPEYLGRRLGTEPQTLRNARRKEGIFSRKTLRHMLWPTAAALVATVVVTVVGWHGGGHSGGRSAAPAVLTYATGNGQRATITLPGGGTVALNVASRLEVPLDYMAGHHTVRLVGEGLFTVPHHEGAPFIVMAGGTAARVLGTSFVVRRYATDTAMLVAVRDGKVAVGSTVVTAHHLLEVGRNSTPQMRSSDTSLFTFATGVLTLNNPLLPAAIVELDRWYDADIRLGSPALATEHLEGRFAAGSLGDLAQILASTFGVRVVRDGRVLTLYPRR
jgi:ferric-dicitrate binding protein FerR (iron transport regulator)